MATFRPRYKQKQFLTFSFLPHLFLTCTGHTAGKSTIFYEILEETVTASPTPAPTSAPTPAPTIASGPSKGKSKGKGSNSGKRALRRSGGRLARKKYV